MMDLQAYGCVVSVAGFIYGSIGYALSILTCIFEAALRRILPKLAVHPSHKRPKLSRGHRTPRTASQGSKSRPSRSCSKEPTSRLSASTTLKANEAPASRSSEPNSSLPPISNAQLRRVASLESLDRRRSFVLVAPVITINHVDRIDNMSIKAPTITIRPNPGGKSQDKIKPKIRSQTMAHPPSLPNLPHCRSSPPAEPNRAAFRLANLKPPWGGEKPKIHRSASSPQLMEFAEQEKPSLKEHCQEKVQPVLSMKNSKKSLKGERRPSSSHSQSPPSRFFASFQNVEKKRPQVSRTQPYNAPYFVPPPVPPVPSNEVRKDGQVKRSTTLPPEKIEKAKCPSTAAQQILLFKTEKT